MDESISEENTDRLLVFDYDGDGKSDICLIYFGRLVCLKDGIAKKYAYPRDDSKEHMMTD